MKIQKGMVKYKDRNDIICVYGITDDGKTYYFLNNDGKSLANGNQIVSTELVEAIDPMYKASKVGVIDSEGNIVIPCENKGVKPITDNVILVEKATPVTESVLQAIEYRSDSLHAAQLVSTPAQIKDNIYREMGNDGRFLFNDQFAEATVYDIDGNNLIENEVYSFIAVNNDQLYLSKNLPDSPVVHFSLNKDKAQENEVTQGQEEKIDVSEVNVPVEVVENALESESLASNGNVIQDNFDIDKQTHLENVNEGLSVPSADDFMAATNLGMSVVKEDSMEMNNDVAQENQEVVAAEEAVPAEEVVEEIQEVVAEEAVPAEEVVEEIQEVVAEEAAPVEEVVEETQEVVTEEAAPVEEVVEETQEVVTEEAAPVEEVVEETQEVVTEEAAPVEEVVEETQEVVTEEVAPVEEVVEETQEVVAEEAAPVEEVVEETQEVVAEETAPIEEVVEETQEVVTEEAAPVEEVFEEFQEVSSEEVAPIESFTEDTVEDKEQPLGEEDIQSLLDETSMDLFGGSSLQLDSIVSGNNDELDNYSFVGTVGSDNLFEDVAKSMTGLIKQNREQRATISNYEDIITELRADVSELQGKFTGAEHQNVELYDRNRLLENAIIKLKTRIEMLATKLHEKDEIIDEQSKELEKLRPQLEGKEQLLDLLRDAKALISEDAIVEDEDDYGYMKAA